MLANGHRRPLHDIAAEVSNLTEMDLRAFMDKWTTDKCIALSGVGKIEGLAAYPQLRIKMNWFRL